MNREVIRKEIEKMGYSHNVSPAATEALQPGFFCMEQVQNSPHFINTLSGNPFGCR